MLTRSCRSYAGGVGPLLYFEALIRYCGGAHGGGAGPVTDSCFAFFSLAVYQLGKASGAALLALSLPLAAFVFLAHCLALVEAGLTLVDGLVLVQAGCCLQLATELVLVEAGVMIVMASEASVVPSVLAWCQLLALVVAICCSQLVAHGLVLVVAC